MVAVFLLLAVGKVVVARDTFNNIGTFFKDVDGTVTFHQGCLRYMAPLKDVVHVVTELVETYVQPF